MGKSFEPQRQRVPAHPDWWRFVKIRGCSPPFLPPREVEELSEDGADAGALVFVQAPEKGVVGYVAPAGVLFPQPHVAQPVRYLRSFKAVGTPVALVA